MRSFIKCASLAVLASLLTLTMLSLMSKTTTAFTFAKANPVGDEPLAYDGSLSALATEAEDPNPSADGIDAARLFCRPGYGRCGWGFNPWCCGPGKVCSIGYRGCCPLGYPYVCSLKCCRYGCTQGGRCACRPNYTVDCGRGCCRRGSRCVLGRFCVPRFFGHSAEGPGIDAPPPPPENRTDPIEAPGGGAPPTAPENPIESK